MRNKIIVLAMMTLLIVPIITINSVAYSGGKTVTVDDDRMQCPGADYTSIQDAIDHSWWCGVGGWGKIIVYPGVYNENIVISGGKRDWANIQGIDPKSTIINSDAAGNAVYISSNWVNFHGFTVTNSESDGIGIQVKGNWARVYNNILLNNGGIGIKARGGWAKIWHNDFLNNGQNGQSGGFYNTWHNGYPSGGNYWDDYTGNDSDGDGIGDIAYDVPGPGADSYPFIHSLYDITPPITSCSLAGEMGSYSWYVSPVEVQFIATDDISGVKELLYRVDNGPWEVVNESIFDVVVEEAGYHTVEYYSIDKAGNAESIKSVSFKIDIASPITSCSFDGKMGNNGWYVSPVEVEFSVTDDMSGVKALLYRVNKGSWKNVSEPIFNIVVNEGGYHTVECYSIDKAGNAEDIKSVHFKIDLETPKTEAILPPNPNPVYTRPIEITLEATDDVSGVDSTLYKLIEDGSVIPTSWRIYTEPIQISASGEYTLQFYSVDKAGNEEEVHEISFIINIENDDIDARR